MQIGRMGQLLHVIAPNCTSIAPRAGLKTLKLGELRYRIALNCTSIARRIVYWVMEFGAMIGAMMAR